MKLKKEGSGGLMIDRNDSTMTRVRDEDQVMNNDEDSNAGSD